MTRILAMTAPVMIWASLLTPVKGQTTQHEQAESILADALKAKNPDTRKEAVKALRPVAGQEPFTTRVEAMLNDGDVQVRVATIEALAGLKNARAIAALKIALDDKVAEVRFAAAKALLKLNDPAGRESLIAMLNGETKVSSGVVAANVRDTKRTLETPNGATKVTLRVGTTLAPVPYLGVGYSATEKMVTRRGGPGRAATALLLAKDKDPEVIAALRNALTDKDANVRAAAVQALAQVADPDSAELFVTMFSDKNQKVRVQAAASYIRLENPSATGTVAVDEE